MSDKTPLYVSIDVETGGLNPRFHSLLSASFVATPDFETIEESHQFFVKHNQFNTTPEAMRINGLNLGFIRNHGIMPRELRRQVETIFEPYREEYELVPIGWRTSFDIGFLVEQVFNEYWTTLFTYRFVDLYSTAMLLYRHKKIPYAGKLQKTAESLGIVEDWHTALGDATAVIKLSKIFDDIIGGRR